MKPLLKLRDDLSPALGDVALVALQHLLPSIPELLERFVAAGMRRDQIFIVGKPYSTVPSVTETLQSAGYYVHLPPERSFNVGEYGPRFAALVTDYWRSVRARLAPAVKRLIILDEGGWLCRAVPDELVYDYAVTGIEHTMFGVHSTPAGGRAFPVILMAASAAKTRFEGAVIADAIIERLQGAIPELHKLQIGVVGLGNIGQAVASALHGLGIERLCGYDKDPQKGVRLQFIQRLRNVSEVVKQCDVVLGCTGQDVFEPGTALLSAKGRRWLGSCSSADIEFLRVLRQLAKRVPAPRVDPFRDARGSLSTGAEEIVILNGGFPLNFDRTAEREPPERIQLTREITYASVMQATLCEDPDCSADEIMLDPDMQQALVAAWLERSGANALFPNWTPPDGEWWSKHSRGRRLTVPLTDFLEVTPVS